MENKKGETKTATLADSGFLIRVPTDSIRRTRFVSISIANPICVSNEDKGPRNKGFLKPAEGIEPSERKMTNLVLLQAAGWKALYYKLFFAPLALLLFVLPSCASASTRLVTIAQPTNQIGLTAYWSFDSSTVSGTTVSDLSGNSHNLTLVNGASITTGKSGQALTLDGTNQYAWGLIGALPTSVSLSMWVKANDVATEQSILTEEGDGAPSSGYHFTLVGIYNGAFYAGFWNIGDIASGPINAGQWYNVVLYYDGVANTQSLYVDGVLQGTQSGTWSPPSDIYFLAGYQQSGCSFTSASGHCGDTAHYFNGQIDDLKGYNRALTSSDIQSLQSQRTYIGHSPKKVTIGHSNTTALSSGLVGYWTFDGSQTSWLTNTTRNSAGSGGTGTLVGLGTTTAPTTGKIGQALLFNGTNYVTGSDASLPSGNAPRTISAWIKPTALPGLNLSGVIANYGTTVTDHAFGISLINISGTQYIRFFGWGDDFDTAQTLPTTSWTQITGVFDGTTAYMYANGVLLGSSNRASWNTVLNHFEIGRNIGVGDYFNGAIDDVRVYNRALSANEVAQLYAMEK